MQITNVENQIILNKKKKLVDIDERGMQETEII
jgi:hypothetical protein